jgi:murein DD-endopeptidase MepM/ murein hydrolase activator NlpD
MLSLILAVGPVGAASRPPQRYRVQPGDTLTAIAERLGSTVPAIVAANRLADPDQIAANRLLVVPPAYAPLLSIVVGPQDTLTGIARRYHSRPEDLAALNEIGLRERLEPGQDLLVPAPAGEPSPALPPGPIVAIQTVPQVPVQGQTVGIRLLIDSSEAISLSVALQNQALPLRQANSGSFWGLAAIDAFAQPGVLPLQIRWTSPSSPSPQTIRWPIRVADAGYPSFAIELPPEKGALLDPELVRAENEKVAAIWNRPETEPAWRGRFRRPIGEEFATSAPFGQRRSYNGGPMNSFHAGQDFSALEGTPVVAPAAGMVALAEPLIVRGNAVILDHGAGLYSGYWHLVDLAVTPGQAVQPGDLLGHVGTTGLSTGNHLHWELRLHGIAVAPLQWVETWFPTPVGAE